MPEDGEPAPSGFGPERWSAYLTAALARPVEVRFGRARRQVLVARPFDAGARGHGYRVRMNAAFAGAPPDVRDAVAGWLRSGRRARRSTARLDAWIEERFAALPPREPARLEPRGTTHDLGELAAELYAADLGPRLLPPERRPRLTWGARRRSPARRSIHLGTYEHALHLVRLHPVLDQPAVPRFFVRFVLFHELLHAALPPTRGRTGRLLHHDARFRALEAAHPDHARATRWQDENLQRLLRSARTGRPLAPRPSLAARLPRLAQGLLFGER